MNPIDFKELGKTVAEAALSEKGQRFLCGTYSNGKTRSVVDALRDEYISPKDRENWEKKKAAKKKKKNKNKKKKKKKNKDYFDSSMFLNF